MKPEVQCRIHKDSSLSSNLSQINPIPRIGTYFFMVNSNIPSHLHLGLPKVLFSVGLPVKILKALLLSSIPATCLLLFKFWLLIYSVCLVF